MPEMIWVLLDESSPTGTHEFADSVNNGPWGTALTTELIPSIEATYRMDARPSGRFLQGHSSGGWATLWLQTHYPRIFGGTWSTSPDPSDFHFFSTIDLYAPHANFYRAPDGTLNPIIREHGKARATMQQLAGLESVLGPYGGQLASFEWVFSPRAADGRPAPLFDRVTGDIDPKVADYWRTHYDIVQYLNNHSKTIAPDLQGRFTSSSARTILSISMEPPTACSQPSTALASNRSSSFGQAAPTLTCTWMETITTLCSIALPRRCIA